jgi:hypothetical protein
MKKWKKKRESNIEACQPAVGNGNVKRSEAARKSSAQRENIGQ